MYIYILTVNFERMSKNSQGYTRPDLTVRRCRFREPWPRAVEASGARPAIGTLAEGWGSLEYFLMFFTSSNNNDKKNDICNHNDSGLRVLVPNNHA